MIAPRPDPELALALARVEAAFGPVEVLEVRHNPPSTTHSKANGHSATPSAGEQTALDLDASSGEVRRS